jgi:hypothetical protein
MLFREIIIVYSEDHLRHIHSVRKIQSFINVKAGGTYRIPSEWYIKIQFVPQRKHITSPLQSPTG